MLRSKLIAFLPFHARSSPRLRAEKSALGSVWQQPKRFIVVCGHVGVEFLVADLRNQSGLLADEITMLCIYLMTALMKVWCGRLGQECIQPKVIKFLRIESK